MMKYIGTIKQTQIQRDRLKIGEKPNQSYRPDPLLTVDAVRLTPHGVIGLTADGGELIDVHHANHPNTRNVQHQNGISVGFTFFYKHMQNRFGEKATIGIAGENIIIDDDGQLDVNGITEGATLIIENVTTGAKNRFTLGRGIPPCRPFTRYITQNPTLDGDELEAHLQFLSNGMRGFYLFLDDMTHIPVIQAGDKVYIAD
ncbi:MAG: hypothetical protein CUN52_00210 [Phototrophicales bacterium]|nr:MAG: hypothetical protein CUN52_00210 [Phototrophicales bacterium]